MTMPFLDAMEDRLYYDVQGSGRPLVLLHGAWASHEWWRYQIPVLADMYRVFSPDIRGHGRSSPLTRKFSVEGLAGDLDIFLEQTGLQAVVIVGWSLGGLIALQYCMDRPEKVMALILIGTRGHRNPAMKPKILVQYFKSLIGLIMVLSAPRKYDRSAEQAWTERIRWHRNEAVKMLSPDASQELVEWIARDLTDHPRQNYLTVARSIWNWEAGEKLGQIEAPTLIIVGERDNITPPRYARLIDDELKSSKLVIVPGGTHYVAMEQAGRVNSEIIRFLEEVGYRGENTADRR